MQIGMVGLGRMGANMARRLMRGGHECVAFDVNTSAAQALAKDGATAATSTGRFRREAERTARDLDDGAGGRRGRHDRPTLLPHLDVRRYRHRRRQLALRRRHPPREANSTRRRLHYVDVGTSGGVWGLERGYCLMIGGETEVVDISIRFSRRWRRRRGDIRAHAGTRKRRRARPSTATCTAGRTARATS